MADNLPDNAIDLANVPTTNDPDTIIVRKNNDIYQISKADLAAVVGGLIGNPIGWKSGRIEVEYRATLQTFIQKNYQEGIYMCHGDSVGIRDDGVMFVFKSYSSNMIYVFLGESGNLFFGTSKITGDWVKIYSSQV